MSTLAAIYIRDGRPVNPALTREIAAMLRRIWIEGPVALAHGTLSAPPEPKSEPQPLADESRAIHLIFDGRIDNREELRAALGGGSSFRTGTDTEIVLRAYQQWGEECPSHLSGDFAFVLWDFAEHKLFCARDPLGRRPFFYALTEHTFACASEMQPLLRLPVHRGLNLKWADGYRGTPEADPELTHHPGLLRLPAGYSLTVDESAAQKRCYWNSSDP